MTQRLGCLTWNLEVSNLSPIAQFWPIAGQELFHGMHVPVLNSMSWPAYKQVTGWPTV